MCLSLVLVFDWISNFWRVSVEVVEIESLGCLSRILRLRYGFIVFNICSFCIVQGQILYLRFLRYSLGYFVMGVLIREKRIQDFLGMYFSVYLGLVGFFIFGVLVQFCLCKFVGVFYFCVCVFFCFIGFNGFFFDIRLGFFLLQLIRDIYIRCWVKRRWVVVVV